MEDKIKIIKSDGSSFDAFLVTFLVNDDKTKRYVVYSKNESYGPENNKIIYISKLLKEDENYYVSEIVEDEEWVTAFGIYECFKERLMPVRSPVFVDEIAVRLIVEFLISFRLPFIEVEGQFSVAVQDKVGVNLLTVLSYDGEV